MVDIQLKTVSRDRCQSFWHVSAESTQGCQTFPIHERGEDAVQCIHQQQTRLLQQLLCRCHYRGLVIIPQSVQNTAARFISKSGKFDHLTPILRDLHWSPVRRRVDFKVHGDTRPQVSARSHATASLRWLYINTSISSLSGRQQCLTVCDHLPDHLFESCLLNRCYTESNTKHFTCSFMSDPWLLTAFTKW